MIKHVSIIDSESEKDEVCMLGQEDDLAGTDSRYFVFSLVQS